MSDEPTYADLWRDAINQTYTNVPARRLLDRNGAIRDDRDYAVEVGRVLEKAAQCLHNGLPATFTSGELDIVRHLMPAHEVHQSGAVRWVLDWRVAHGEDIEDIRRERRNWGTS